MSLDIKSKKPIVFSDNNVWGTKQNEITDDIEDFVNALELKTDSFDFNKQDSSSDLLTTADKTIVGAINEVKIIAQSGAGIMNPYTIKGNNLNDTSTVKDLTASQVKTMLALNNVNNTTDLNKPISTATQTALDDKVNESLRNVPYGFGGLDSSARLSMNQMPGALATGVNYMGVWDASTNTPTLPASPTEKADLYVVTTAGTKFGITFYVGDAIISKVGGWDKIGQNLSVSSVNGYTGVINLNKADIGLSNVNNTADINKAVAKLNTPVNITINGEASGTVSFDGSTDVNINVTLSTIPLIKYALVMG